jgi:hypothetical protein
MQIPGLRRPPLWAVAPAAALGWWVVGFLPRVVHGEGPGPMDPSLLSLLVVFAFLGGFVGGATAGLRRDRPVAAGLLAVAGAVVALAVGVVVMGGDPTFNDRVVTGLRAITAVMTGLGLLCGLLATLGPAVLRGTALAAPAVCAPGWLANLLPGQLDPTVARWILGLCLGAALALTVRRSPLGLVGWLPAGVLAWATQSALPAFVAVGPMIHTGSGLDDVSPLVEAGRDYFHAAWTTPDAHDLPAWVIAVVVGLLAAAWRLRPRTSVPDAAPETTPEGEA